MDLIEAIEGRRSVREFKDKELPKGFLETAVRLGNLAPSAGNLQARDFIIVKDTPTKKMLALAAHGQNFVAQAQAVIVVCTNTDRISRYGHRGRELYMFMDAAAAIENILLYTYSKGLGSCWVGAFNDRAVSDNLKLPDFIKPVALLPIGYPNEVPPDPGRLSITKLLHDGKW